MIYILCSKGCPIPAVMLEFNRDNTYRGCGEPSATHVITTDSPGLKYIFLLAGCDTMFGGRLTERWGTDLKSGSINKACNLGKMRVPLSMPWLSKTARQTDAQMYLYKMGDQTVQGKIISFLHIFVIF